MSETSDQQNLARRVVDYLDQILRRGEIPPASPELSAVEGFDDLCRYLDQVKGTLHSFSVGDFDQKLKLTGAAAGYVKGVQSNLRHLAWQCGAIASGDMRHRVDFMGDLSEFFNRMADSLVNQEEMIRRKQEQLEDLATSLKAEIAKKDTIEAALRDNEEMYRQQSLRDPLTWLYNRGYFFEAAARFFEELKRRRKGTVCLLMMDIDHFKPFNDTYGHLAGDRALKMVAEGISGILRKSDIFARYGGEEFILLLTDSSLQDGLNIAERISKSVSRQPVAVHDERVSITVSIGLHYFEAANLDHEASPDDLLIEAIGQADAALYAAKRAGRNQVRLSAGAEAASGH